MGEQLSLWNALTSKHIEVCVRCEAEIVTIDHPDHTTSDYRNAKGECFKCGGKKESCATKQGTPTPAAPASA
jgi:hypothetical protein